MKPGHVAYGRGARTVPRTCEVRALLGQDAISSPYNGPTLRPFRTGDERGKPMKKNLLLFAVLILALAGCEGQQAEAPPPLYTIDQFMDGNIQLPVILDDILVNYDQERTEAAVETLLQFSEKGHQVIMLTCHQHLAELFSQKGVDPVMLHTHRDFNLERKAG